MSTQSQPAGAGVLENRLILFVTGDSPRSVRARANLAAALAAAGFKEDWPREIDLLQEPEQAIAYGMFATPALLRMSRGNAPSVLYGDLSDPASLVQFLADMQGVPEP